MKTVSFGTTTIYLPKTDSTNLEAWRNIKSRSIVEGTMIWTSDQTEGKGAGHNIWFSESEKNLTASFVIFPKFLEAEKQFFLNKVISLAVRESVYNLLKKKHEVFVKWPNDIIVNNSKVAGILIENTILGNNLNETVIGIGLNVNQDYFPSNLNSPTSLKNITNKTLEIYKCAEEICKQLTKWYNLLIKSDYQSIDNKYLSHLYRLNEYADYKADGKVIEGKIIGISEYGKLRLMLSTGETREYAFKEVELIY
ncbi:MAG: biotin--[acetyl-CoA-carboxylase] ligase [Bacteroidetes bacterium]|nr:biotin--[acetyl-CoA-carboxylase] ligase [Bacteroidota bacterium]